jgi:hypothetical protein
MTWNLEDARQVKIFCKKKTAESTANLIELNQGSSRWRKNRKPYSSLAQEQFSELKLPFCIILSD